jgi:type VI secretion system secreted protein Hcp
MFTAYAKIDNMPGEATEDGHKDWIELVGYNFAGVQQQAGSSVSKGGALASGRSEMKPLTLNKYVDKASPKLFEACMKGTHIPKIQIEICRSTGGSKPLTFMKYEIDKAMIVGFDQHGYPVSTSPTSATEGGDLPMETVEIVGVQHKATYTETDVAGKKKGDVSAQYDVSKAK